MNFLKPPKTEYTDLYDQSKFRLVWNFAIAIIILLIAVSISNYSNVKYDVTPNIIAVAICFIVLINLQRTRKYKLTAQIAVICILLLISTTFFALKDIVHFTSPLWMILNILLAFFILGQIWGVTILIIHFLALFVYFSTALGPNLMALKPLNNHDIANYIIECAIIAFGIVYILRQYIKTNSSAENQIKETNKTLLEQNELIIVQNQEKEMMLKEIHHRVKNNLQIITSILRLQSYEIEDKEHLETFNEAINRVSSISLIHEKMYQSDMLTNFDLEDYFKSLAMNIVSSYNFTKEVIIESKSALDSVQFKAIVPIALVYNELVTNSVKHAFSVTEFPKIMVDFASVDSETFRMTFSDNGKWKENSEDSFGTEMIETMTEQLDGSYKIEKNDNGTTYHFIFKNISDNLK